MFRSATILTLLGSGRYEASLGVFNLNKVVDATEVAVYSRGACTHLRMDGGETLLVVGPPRVVLGADNVFDAKNSQATTACKQHPEWDNDAAQQAQS